MPKLLDRLVKKIEKQGKSKDIAYAIAESALQKYGYLKPGTTELTAKGLIKQSLPEGVKGIPRKMKNKKKLKEMIYKYKK